MPHESAPDWHAREVATWQGELDLLRCLLEAITLRGKAHEATPGHRVMSPGQPMDRQHGRCGNTP